MNSRHILVLVLGAAALGCAGARGPAGPPGASPSSAEVAAALARSPEFARAVASEMARATPPPVVATPVDQPASGQDTAMLTVVIDRNGVISVDNRTMTDAEFRVFVAERQRAAPGVRARLAVDRGAMYNRVVAVIDALHAEGVTRVSFLTVPAP